MGDFEPSHFYLSMYKEVFSKRKFDSLVVKLIRDNMDIQSVSKTIVYVYNNKLCEFSDIIRAKCDRLNKISPDSTWQVEIKDGYFRNYKTGEIIYYMCMCHRLNEFVPCK
jgi:hypothetical protein